MEEDSDDSQAEISEPEQELESKGLEELPRESQNDRVQRLFEHTTASDDLNPLSRLGIELAKQKKPSVKLFNGSAIKFVAFKASINHLKSKGLYDEDELLDIVLDHVGGEAEKAVRGVLPGSGQFKRAMAEILEQRFGNDRVIVNANLAALKSHSVVQEKRADQLRALSNVILAMVGSFKSLNIAHELKSGSLVQDAVSKLPQSLFYRWHEWAGEHPTEVNLEKFCSWIDRKARH